MEIRRLKYVITKMENLLQGLNSRFEIAGESVTFKIDYQKLFSLKLPRIKFEEKWTEFQRPVGLNQHANLHVIRVPEKENREKEIETNFL